VRLKTSNRDILNHGHQGTAHLSTKQEDILKHGHQGTAHLPTKQEDQGTAYPPAYPLSSIKTGRSRHSVSSNRAPPQGVPEVVQDRGRKAEAHARVHACHISSKAVGHSTDAM
jgi:hypothetical protein